MHCEIITCRIAWGATIRRWLTWACLLSMVSVADAKPQRKVPDRDKSAEVKKREANKRAERERAIRECTEDRDGDPDEDREICEDEVGP